MIHTQRPADDTAPVSDLHFAILEIMARGDKQATRTTARKVLAQHGRKI